MALIVKDRVLETCSTSGLVDFTLTGAVTGYQRFSAIGNGNTTYYAAYVIGSNDWEVGIGTVGTSSLTRDTILSSSTGSKVNFAGNPVVWCDLPSSKALFTDSNNNATANSFLGGFTSVTASGTQIVLTASSTPDYVVTGSGGQTIKLPDATTLPNGYVFSFDNNQSSGAITVNNNSNTLVVSVPSGGYVLLRLLSNSIAAGSWDRHDLAPSNVSWSTNTFDYPGSITSATWNGNVIAVNRGGTGLATVTAGQVIYGNGTSALATSANMTFDGNKLTLANDASISGMTVGKGAGSIASNMALGFQALNANTSGSGIVAIGYQAQYSSTSAQNMVSIGFQANYNLPLCTGNGVSVGYLAGYSQNNSNCGYNTLIGYKAGTGITSGYGNCFVGSNSQTGAGAGGAVTTGVQNTIIGGYDGSATPISETGSNYVVLSTGGGVVMAYAQSGGGWYQQNNAVNWSITSDIRIKKNVVSLESGLDVISALRPVEFDYIENNKHDIGFIAQEYQKVLPTQISEGEDGMLSLNQNLVPYLVKAIQELRAEVQLLKSQLGTK